MSTLEMPFTVGQTLWMAVSDPRQVRVACPVCFGKLAVVVELGNGERLGVPCDGCGLGFDGPRGYIDQYEHQPKAEPFTIAGLHSVSADEWRVKNEAGDVQDLSRLYPDEATALAVATTRASDQHEDNMRRMNYKRGDVQRKSWSVRYHREQIKDLQRRIDWHQKHIQPAE